MATPLSSQESGDSGETCTHHCAIPTSVASRCVMSSLVTRSNVAAEGAAKSFVKHQSECCVVYSECAAYGLEHLLVSVRQLCLDMKVYWSNGA